MLVLVFGSGMVCLVFRLVLGLGLPSFEKKGWLSIWRTDGLMRAMSSTCVSVRVCESLWVCRRVAVGKRETGV